VTMLQRKARFHNVEEGGKTPSVITLTLHFALNHALRSFSTDQPSEFISGPRDAPGLNLPPHTTEASITWIGHSTFLLRIAGQSILTDPVLGRRVGNRFLGVRRLTSPGLSYEQLPQIDVVVISHSHYDHLDNPTIRQLGRRPIYLVPLGMGSHLWGLGCNKIIEYNWWESIDVLDISFSLVPAQHSSYRSPWDRNRTLWGGWVIHGGGTRIYFAGDTAYFGEFRRIATRYAPIDFALLPIGGYEPQRIMRSLHMTPEEAGQAYLDLAARVLVPMHWGTFPLTAERTDEPFCRLYHWWTRNELDSDNLWSLNLGETRSLAV
jgi:L-ascorbate metabolism protein UlaG (beta-lactamase superfamily)